LQKYNLELVQKPPKAGDVASIYLQTIDGGNISDATMTVLSLSFTLTNDHQQSATVNYTINLSGPPKPDQSLPKTQGTQAGSIDPVSLTNAFKNPTQSGDIASYRFGDPSPSTQGIHLNVQNNQIVGTLDKDVTPGDYTVPVYATNSVGESETANNLVITVAAVQVPTFTTNPETTPGGIAQWQKGSANPNADIVDINSAGSGTLNPVDLSSPNAQ